MYIRNLRNENAQVEQVPVDAVERLLAIMLRDLLLVDWTNKEWQPTAPTAEDFTKEWVKIHLNMISTWPSRKTLKFDPESKLNTADSYSSNKFGLRRFRKNIFEVRQMMLSLLWLMLHLFGYRHRITSMEIAIDVVCQSNLAKL